MANSLSDQTTSEPESGKAPGKKMTTRVISLPPAEEARPQAGDVSAPVTAPKIIPAKPGDTTPITPGATPTVSPEVKPKTATTPLEGILTQAEARKSGTIHISLTDVLPSSKPSPDGRRPTGPVLDPSTLVARPPTIQLKRPPTSPITIQPDMMTPAAPTRVKPSSPPEPPPAAAGDKKGTTRLILDATAPTVSSMESKRATGSIAVIPQTIRLKRPGTAFITTPPHKGGTNMLREAQPRGPIPPSPPSKTATSRVLVEETAPTPPLPYEVKHTTSMITMVPTPHTIRLKRPSTPPVEGTSPAGLAAESPTVQKAKKSETAKIDLAKSTDSVPMTQRKTIKIKRTERSTGPRTVILKKSGAGMTPVPGQPEAVEHVLVETDAPSPLVFGLAAAAAVLIAGLVYIMAAQVFSPELVLPVPASLL